jgi:hypothetical protein
MTDIGHGKWDIGGLNCNWAFDFIIKSTKFRGKN